MPWSAAAVIGGALISSQGSKNAAKSQAGASDRAAELQNEQYQQTRQDQLAQLAQQRQDQLAQLAQQRTDTAPYREAGYGALSQLTGGLAAGGDFNRNFSLADYQQDPGYQFRQQEGEQAINRAATAGGGRYSGATLKALQRFNSGLASQEYGNAYSRFNTDVGNRFNRLSSLAGTGQTSVSQIGQAGQSTATNIGQAGQNAYGNIGQAGSNAANNGGNALQNAAAARASGYVGMGNAINGAIGTLANNYQQNQYLSRLNGSSGSGYIGNNDYYANNDYLTS